MAWHMEAGAPPLSHLLLMLFTHHSGASNLGRFRGGRPGGMPVRLARLPAASSATYAMPACFLPAFISPLKPHALPSSSTLQPQSFITYGTCLLGRRGMVAWLLTGTALLTTSTMYVPHASCGTLPLPGGIYLGWMASLNLLPEEGAGYRAYTRTATARPLQNSTHAFYHSPTTFRTRAPTSPRHYSIPSSPTPASATSHAQTFVLSTRTPVASWQGRDSGAHG